MNKQEFSYLINNPTKINKEQTKELENVITSFPYFQSARALYLKGLKNEGSFKYNQTLKTSCLLLNKSWVDYLNKQSGDYLL